MIHFAIHFRIQRDSQLEKNEKQRFISGENHIWTEQNIEESKPA